MPEQSQYAAAAHVPLIKSPSLRVPRPVQLPQDIHPLPQSVTPYFVYPFTLEPHVLTLEAARRSTFAAHAARRAAVLRARAEEGERRRREALRRVAPGFEPSGGLLVPEQRGLDHVGGEGEERGRDVMEEMVDQLAALEGP